MSQGGSNKKVANSLVALSAAAVLAVYSAGFLRTRSAAHQFELQAADRMPARSGNNEPAAHLAGEAPDSPGSMTPSRGPAPESGSPLQPGTRVEPKAVIELPAIERQGSAAPVSAAVVSTPVPATSPAPAPVPAPSAEPAAPPPASLAPAAVVPPVAPPAGTLAPPPPAKAAWKDGTYYGWGTSRHGNIQAAVVIDGGRIASATISQCRTRYSCSVIDRLPPQVALRQSPEVDYVSGATQSTNAFYYAVVEALGQAK